MGRLYKGCVQVSQAIDSAGLDKFKTRGAFALETGFLISLIGENEPDDPERIAKLQAAAQKILGITLSI